MEVLRRLKHNRLLQLDQANPQGVADEFGHGIHLELGEHVRPVGLDRYATEWSPAAQCSRSRNSLSMIDGGTIPDAQMAAKVCRVKGFASRGCTCAVRSTPLSLNISAS